MMTPVVLQTVFWIIDALNGFSKYLLLGVEG